MKSYKREDILNIRNPIRHWVVIFLGFVFQTVLYVELYVESFIPEAVNIQQKTQVVAIVYNCSNCHSRFFNLVVLSHARVYVYITRYLYMYHSRRDLKGYAFPSLTPASECHSPPRDPLVLLNVNVTIQIWSVLVSNSFFFISDQTTNLKSFLQSKVHPSLMTMQIMSQSSCSL